MTMTYAQALDVAINAVSDAAVIDPAVVEKLTALKEQLAKRSTSKTPTKAQKENAILKERILEALADIGSPTTITALLEHGVEWDEKLTNQKVSALLRQLIDAERVVKTIEGKKAMFALA